MNKVKPIEVTVTVSRPLFWTVTVCLLLLPLSVHYKLLLCGVRAQGVVVPIQKIDLNQIESHINVAHRAIIHFKADDEIVQVFGPENIPYEIGELVPILYRSGDPTDCIVYSFRAIYFSPFTAIPLILLLLWLAFFFAFAKSDKIKRKKINKLTE